MKALTLFSGASTLNTVSDPVRIPFDPESGYSDLAAAVNVTIKQDGRPTRRKGYTSVASGVFHSLFCDGGACFVAKNHGNEDALYLVASDLSLVGVRSGLKPGERFSYFQDSSRTFYSNGYQNGVIENGVSTAWPAHERIGETNRALSGAPVGRHIALGHGRALVAYDDIVEWSDPFKYGLFDRARSFWRFGDRVVMVKPVSGGVYVSTDKRIYFMAGTSPADATQIECKPYPAIEYSLAIEMVDGMEIGLDSGLCALWATPEGACIGTPSGMVINVTREKINYRPAETGAGLLHGYNFIQAMF